MKPKHHSENSSSSFLQRFFGKLTKIDKSGTLKVNSKPLLDLSNVKSKTALIDVKPEYTIEISTPLPSIIKKKSFKVSQKSKTNVIQHSQNIQYIQKKSPAYYIDSILPKNLNLEMDFKQMLQRLNHIEQKHIQRRKL